MEKTLANQYQDVLKNKGYYGIESTYEELFGQEEKKECYTFLNDHFECGGKKTALIKALGNKWDIEMLQGSMRCVHMVSLYLLGRSLEDCIGEAVKKILANHVEAFRNPDSQENWYDFRHIWYLITLSHDITYCQEKLSVEKDKFDNIMKTGHTIFDYKMQDGTYFCPRFSKELIYKYEKYRANKGSNDHGILAGSILFDSLYNEYEKKLDGKKMIIDESLVYWRRDQLDQLAYISDAIIGHNIWVPDLDKEKEYEENGLQELIDPNGQKRLNFNQYPLHFLLCLLDTLEPIKRFCNEEYIEKGEKRMASDEVLRSISIQREEAKEGKRSIKIEWEKNLESVNKKVFDLWLNGIDGLINWLDVTVNRNDMENHKCRVIEFNSNVY